MLYFDYAATTPDYYNGAQYSGFWPNANSQYETGLMSAKVLEEARIEIKKMLDINSGYIVFGPSASLLSSIIIDRFNEIVGTKSRIFTSYFEHDSIFNKARDFFVDYEDLEVKTINKSPFLVCLMDVNNITGCVHLTKNFYEKVHEKNGFVLGDATATFGHWYHNKLTECCDCFVCSAHKFFGEKGIGFAWLSEKFGWFLGLNKNSHNEYGLIPGTPNVQSIVAMKTALYYNIGNVELEIESYEKMAKSLVKTLNAARIDCKIFELENYFKSYAINTIIFKDIDAEALIQYLSSKEIYISAAHSACAENNDYRVLNAYGVSDIDAQKAVRISFSPYTTNKEIEELAKAIIEFHSMYI